MKVSIVIPAYNEEGRIGETLDNYTSVFENARKSRGLDYEILVVINNTKDNTEGIVKSKAQKNKRILCMNLKEKGKGFAVMTGFKDALNRDNDLIGFVDADRATSADEYLRLVLNIRNSDGIIANRYHKKSQVEPKFTFRRVFVGKGFNFVVRSLMFMPYRDTQCGAKVFKREAIQDVVDKVVMSQWAFDVELLYHLNKAGFKVREYPTKWVDMDGSTLNVRKASMQMFMAVCQMRAINSPFKNLLKPLKPFVSYTWRALG